MSQFKLCLVITLSFLISTVGAILDCSDPPEETEIFFDLVELKSLATKYPDVIQTPEKCSADNECSDQICCRDEKGCCYDDTKNKRKICGCKAKNDTGCPRGPPVAYIRTYRCDDPHSADSYTCIRSFMEGEDVDGSVDTSIGPVSRDIGNQVNQLLSAVSSLTGQLANTLAYFGNVELLLNSGLVSRFVNGIPNDQLLNMMDTEKLLDLARQVMAKHAQGLPYGRQENPEHMDGKMTLRV